MSESAEKKKGPGCLHYVIRFVVIIIGLNILFWLIQLGFRQLYPPTTLTQALVPFQNNYLAFTDAFITSELGNSEFTDDPGPISRLIFSGALVFAVTVLLVIIIALVPGLTRLGQYVTGWFFGSMMVAALLHSAFVPSTKTFVNQDRKQLEVTNFAWGIIPDKKIIPFTSIQNFDYNLFEYWGHDHNYTIYAQLMADVDGQKIFLGENEIGSHGDSQEAHDAWKMSTTRRAEMENALQALRDLTGLKDN